VPRLADALDGPGLVRAARLLAAAGVTKARLTGGEPLLRPDLPDVAAALGRIPGVTWSLTTNGQRLAGMAGMLARAGFSRVNVSVDSLDPEVFRRITGGGDLARTLAGCREAERAGLVPVKWNVVVLRGINDGEAERFAAETLDRAIEVRFIECMPSPGGLADPEERYVPAAEVRARIERRFALTPLPRGRGATAELFAIPGARGRIGFIAPHSAPFCAECNRLRLGSDGVLRPCLCRTDGLDLAALFAAGATDAGVSAEISGALARWPRGLRPDPARAAPAAPMHLLGG
jgi:cyclic pyranopterin phosphate synthase